MGESARTCSVIYVVLLFVILICCMQKGGSFKPFKLPSSALFFKPPKTKTENMHKKDFLGHAIVVASVQENDDFTGFLGAQGQVRRALASSQHTTSASEMALERVV